MAANNPLDFLTLLIDLSQLPASPWQAFIVLFGLDQSILWVTFLNVWVAVYSLTTIYIVNLLPINEHQKASLNRNIYLQKAKNQYGQKGQFSL